MCHIDTESNLNKHTAWTLNSGCNCSYKCLTTAQLNSDLAGLEASSSICRLTFPNHNAMQYKRVLAISLSYKYGYTDTYRMY